MLTDHAFVDFQIKGQWVAMADQHGAKKLEVDPNL